MQVVAAVNDLVHFAFDLNGAGGDFTGDFSRLANKDFFRGQLSIDGAVDRGFFGNVERALESDAVANHQIVGLINIGCHKSVSL
jgi:hypothetical protein